MDVQLYYSNIMRRSLPRSQICVVLLSVLATSLLHRTCMLLFFYISHLDINKHGQVLHLLHYLRCLISPWGKSSNLDQRWLRDSPIQVEYCGCKIRCGTVTQYCFNFGEERHSMEFDIRVLDFIGLWDLDCPKIMPQHPRNPSTLAIYKLGT